MNGDVVGGYVGCERTSGVPVVSCSVRITGDMAAVKERHIRPRKATRRNILLLTITLTVRLCE